MCPGSGRDAIRRKSVFAHGRVGGMPWPLGRVALVHSRDLILLHADRPAVACQASQMPTLGEDGWQLESGVERHAEAPDSFEIPDESVRSRLVPTSDAKLIFTLRGPDGPQLERMWVQITGYSDTGYIGVLNNEPRTQGAPIALGQTVEFGPDHIIDALPPANWNAETGDYES
jgi:hypothetical protein